MDHRRPYAFFPSMVVAGLLRDRAEHHRHHPPAAPAGPRHGGSHPEPGKQTKLTNWIFFSFLRIFMVFIF